MKKVGILTINDYSNYGNRLQNYAVQEVIMNYKYKVETIQNKKGHYNKNYKVLLKNSIKNFIKKYSFKFEHIRDVKFLKFNKNINMSSIKIDSKHIDESLSKKFDYFITGSDQVWNPKFDRLSDIDLLEFADDNQKISFSASFGINELPNEYKEKTEKALKSFKAISVREDVGKKIVEELTGRNDIEVLIDPTMLLSAEEWDKVSKKPKKLKLKKYILNYFLGELPKEWKREINRIAEENNCKIINILDKNDPFYATGPSEFLYLEKNAFLICTDSFHSSVFSIIYDTPFIVFDRKQKDVESMNSRIDTLLSKFNLTNRRFDGKIDSELLSCDYTEAKKILKKEQKKSIEFLENAFDIKK